VPCVICADFKYRNNKLCGKFFFRSCDAYNLLPFDIFYCVGVIEQLFHQIKMNQFSGKIEIGSVLFWFSRIYVSRFDIGQSTEMIRLIQRFNANGYDERSKPLTSNVLVDLRALLRTSDARFCSVTPSQNRKQATAYQKHGRLTAPLRCSPP
jgi:hypothetical protein